ncbi:MAG TPA: hypothetical protein VGZ22_13670 [Isosphaeraceae bacterium]|nr:hypothetical protein [Isosphaeraceae bacterium]
MPRVILIGLTFLLGVVSSATIAYGADPVPWPLGKWRVVERGWALDSPLQGLEIRNVNAAGDAIVIAHTRDAAGSDRVWGSAKLDHQTVSAAGARWIKAEWTAGDDAVVLQLRHGRADRLEALLRMHPKQRPGATADRVRQATLEREDADGKVVLANGVRGAPEPSRGELAGLFVVKPDGSGLRLVAGPDGFTRAAQPAWSPDGRWIAFVAFDATGRDPLIRIVEAKGGSTTAVAAGISPTWSHDGQRLAYVASGRADFATDWSNPGRNEERIEAVRLAGPGAGEIEVLARGLWPRWSPKDDGLAFVSRRESNWDLYLRSADGLRVSRLTDDPALDTKPVWTADGRALMFLSDRDNRWDLYRVPADGKGMLERLTNQRRREDAADLSPDGEQVAFTEVQNRTSSRILILELASGLVHPLLDSPDADRDPAWSPDAHFLAFASHRPDPSGR